MKKSRKIAFLAKKVLFFALKNEILVFGVKSCTFSIGVIQLNRGRLIREHREKLGLTAQDLAADKKLSTGTISKIENGGDCSNINDNKFEIYLKKLGLTEEKLDQLAKQDEIKQTTMYFVLTAIESNIEAETVTASEIDDAVKEFDIKPLHPYYSTIQYLHGKRLFKKRRLDKAKEFFLGALNDRSPEDNKHLNIAAASYNRLSYASYLENNIDQALIYIEKGLEHFVRDGERQYIEPTLLINKAVYLEKLGDIDGAESILEQLVCPRLDIVKKAYNFVLLHQVKADIYIARNQYDKASELLKTGIELARINRLYNLQCSLWMTLGNLCYKHDQIELAAAEQCFMQALRLENKVDNKQLLVSTYRKIGIVYMRLQKWDESQKYLLQAVKLAQKHNDVLRHIDTLVALGRWFDRQDHKTEAAIKYNEALILAEQYKFHNKQREIELLLKEG